MASHAVLQVPVDTADRELATQGAPVRQITARTRRSAPGAQANEAGTGEQDIRTGPQIRAFLCAGVRAEGPLVAGLPGARAEGEPGGPREKSATAGSASSCRRRYPCLLYLPCRPCRPPARHQSRHQARQSKSGARRHQAQKRGGTTTPRAQCGREKCEGAATRRGKWPAWRDCPRAPRLRGGARTSPAIARSSNLAEGKEKRFKF